MRRWGLGRWLGMLLLGLLLVGGLATLWILRTNQIGRFVADRFHDRLPATLRIGGTRIIDAHTIIFDDVRLSRTAASPVVVTVRHIIVAGELYRGHVDDVRIEDIDADVDADGVRFLRSVIEAEVAHKGSGHPRLIHIEITGAVAIDHRPWLTAVQAQVVATGPQVAVTGSGELPGGALQVAVDTQGVGEDLHYRIQLLRAGLSPRALIRQLADLQLVGALDDESSLWIPELAAADGSVVVADEHCKHFTGDVQLRWAAGRLDGAMTLDRQHIRLDQLHVQDAAAGELSGSLAVDFDDHVLDVQSLLWHPGPRIPIPPQVPTEAILAAMPQARLRGHWAPGGWTIQAELTGSGSALLSWRAGQPFVVDGSNVPLALLQDFQSFLPADLTLAAGRADTLHLVLDHGLRVFTAVVEQTRILWRDWALGTVDGSITIQPGDADGHLATDVVLPPIGTIHYHADGAGGHLEADLTAIQALILRLKGPASLPDLRGAIRLRADLQPVADGLIGRSAEIALEGIEVPDVLRDLAANFSGRLSVHGARAQVDLDGRLQRGALRLPSEIHAAGDWLDLAARQPIFRASLRIDPTTLAADRILLRATDAFGAPRSGGYSAGLQGAFSLTDLRGSVSGVVDHADLGWLTTLEPLPNGRMQGQCAVTFTAALDHQGIQDIVGYVLPLNADVVIGPSLHMSGITGSIRFAIARPPARATAAPAP